MHIGTCVLNTHIKIRGKVYYINDLFFSFFLGKYKINSDTQLTPKGTDDPETKEELNLNINYKNR